MIAEHLTEAEIREVRKMFNDLDVSKTGTLTVEELKGALVDFPEIAEQIETLVRERERESETAFLFSCVRREDIFPHFRKSH